MRMQDKSVCLQINRTGWQRFCLFVYISVLLGFGITGYIHILGTSQYLVKLATVQRQLQPVIMGHCHNQSYIQHCHVNKCNPVKSTGYLIEVSTLSLS